MFQHWNKCWNIQQPKSTCKTRIQIKIISKSYTKTRWHGSASPPDFRFLLPVFGVGVFARVRLSLILKGSFRSSPLSLKPLYTKKQMWRGSRGEWIATASPRENSKMINEWPSISGRRLLRLIGERGDRHDGNVYTRVWVFL